MGATAAKKTNARIDRVIIPLVVRIPENDNPCTRDFRGKVGEHVRFAVAPTRGLLPKCGFWMSDNGYSVIYNLPLFNKILPARLSGAHKAPPPLLPSRHWVKYSLRLRCRGYIL